MDAKSCYEHEMGQFFRLRQPNNDKMVFRYIIIDENAARRAAKNFETKKFHSLFRAKKTLADNETMSRMNDVNHCATKNVMMR